MSMANIVQGFRSLVSVGDPVKLETGLAKSGDILFGLPLSKLEEDSNQAVINGKHSSPYKREEGQFYSVEL